MALDFSVRVDTATNSLIIKCALSDGPAIMALLQSAKTSAPDDGVQRYTFDELIEQVGKEPPDMQLKFLQTFANSLSALRTKVTPRKPEAAPPRPQVPGAPDGAQRSAQAKPIEDVVENWPRRPVVTATDDEHAEQSEDASTSPPEMEKFEDVDPIDTGPHPAEFPTDYEDEEREAIQTESATADAAQAIADANPTPKLESSDTPAQNAQTPMSRVQPPPASPENDPGTPRAEHVPQSAQASPQAPQETPATPAPRQPGQAAVVQAAAQAAVDAHPPSDGQAVLQYGREPGQHVRGAEHAGQTVPAAAAAAPLHEGPVYDVGQRGASAPSAADEFLDSSGIQTEQAQPVEPIASSDPEPPLSPPQTNGGVPDEVRNADTLRVVFAWLHQQGHMEPKTLAEAAFQLKEQIPLVARARGLEERARTWLERMQVLDQAGADARATP